MTMDAIQAFPVNDLAVVAEVRAAFDRYEKALTGNDIVVLDELFWDHAATVRFGAGEELFGYGEIAAFRRTRAAVGLDRHLEQVKVVTFGDSFAIASATFTRDGVPGVGRQSQTWVRTPAGWRIAGAHVSQRP